jgi:hypothetical protein
VCWDTFFMFLSTFLYSLSLCVLGHVLYVFINFIYPLYLIYVLRHVLYVFISGALSLYTIKPSPCLQLFKPFKILVFTKSLGGEKVDLWKVCYGERNLLLSSRKRRDKKDMIGESQPFRERNLSTLGWNPPEQESNPRPSAYKADALIFKITLLSLCLS